MCVCACMCMLLNNSSFFKNYFLKSYVCKFEIFVLQEDTKGNRTYDELDCNMVRSKVGDL